jgi:D-galacturonate reductase
MKYTPSDGKFVGQHGYGYRLAPFDFDSCVSVLLYLSRSFEVFVDAVAAMQRGYAMPHEFDDSLATLSTTLRTTAILEAGRLSLDHNKQVSIAYDNVLDNCLPSRLIVSSAE